MMLVGTSRMKDPSLHEPSKKILQIGPIKPAFLDESPQKGQSTPTHHQGKPKPRGNQALETSENRTQKQLGNPTSIDFPGTSCH